MGALWHLVYPWHGLGSCIVTNLVSFYGPSGTLSESELVLANALHVRQANGLSAKPSDSLSQKHWISLSNYMWQHVRHANRISLWLACAATELASQSYLLALRCSSCIVPHSRKLSMWTSWHFPQPQFLIGRALHHLSMPAGPLDGRSSASLHPSVGLGIGIH